MCHRGQSVRACVFAVYPPLVSHYLQHGPRTRPATSFDLRLLRLPWGGSCTGTAPRLHLLAWWWQRRTKASECMRPHAMRAPQGRPPRHPGPSARRRRRSWPPPRCLWPRPPRQSPPHQPPPPPPRPPRHHRRYTTMPAPPASTLASPKHSASTPMVPRPRRTTTTTLRPPPGHRHAYTTTPAPSASSCCSALSNSRVAIVCHRGLEPRTSRTQEAGLLLTRLSLALDRLLPWLLAPRAAGP